MPPSWPMQLAFLTPSSGKLHLLSCSMKEATFKVAVRTLGRSPGGVGGLIRREGLGRYGCLRERRKRQLVVSDCPAIRVFLPGKDSEQRSKIPLLVQRKNKGLCQTRKGKLKKTETGGEKSRIVAAPGWLS